MDTKEIQQYLADGSSKSVCINRRLMNEYVNTVRDIYILQGNRLRLEFICYGNEDGGLTYYLHYTNLDDLVASLEAYLETNISDWVNCTQTGNYYEMSGASECSAGQKLLKDDLVGHKIKLPTDWESKTIHDGCYTILFDGSERGEVMCFSVQASNPRFSGQYDPEDDSLAYALETCFSIDEEDAFMKWNYVFIPLNYKYDVSYILYDCLRMLEALLGNQHGEHLLDFVEQSFFARWNMSWEEDNLTIVSQWDSVPGTIEPLLNERNVLEISKTAFINEWRMLLAKVIEALTACGYNESAVSQYKQFEHEYGLLKDIYSRIDGVGRCYK